MARETGVTGPKVGKYSVDVVSFENVAIPSVRFDTNASARKRAFVVIDEIGGATF